MEFSLKEIITLLMKRFVLISICTFGGLFVFFVFSVFIVSPSYTASVQMYVNPNESTSLTNLTDLDYAQKVVRTYINFLETKVFFREVIEESNLDYTENELRKMTTIQSVNSTEIFQISITSNNPEDSFILVEAMQKIAPKLIKSIKDTTEISVVDPPVLPIEPTSPNILLNTLIGGMAGFMISVFSLFLWEIIDVNVKNQEDLLKKYELPVLGAIPNFTVNNHKKILLKKRIPFFIKKKIESQTERITEDKKFLVNEAYKAFRANLRFSLRMEGCKKIIISSPVPEDGKSTTSTNIAITTAQTGARVLLIDCDLRKGKLHSSFNLKSSPGVSDCLSGLVEVRHVLCDTSHENLHIITMGSIPPNPTELMASKQMEDLLGTLEKEYDYIIIDTPPINVVSDSLSLVKLVDGVILVVREGMTSHPNITSALTKYEFAKANILGFVINGISLNQGKGYNSKYYNKYKND